MARSNLARKKKHSSRSHVDTSTPQSKHSQHALEFLSTLLPKEWEAFFQTRSAGKRMGLRIICPLCEGTAPDHLNYYQRWRWMSVHIAQHKPMRGLK